MKHLAVAATWLALALAVSSATAAERGGSTSECPTCQPLRHYDTEEVIRTTQEVDHSRVIETQSVIPSKRVIETNHLVVHENETRNIGTVQHNHTIIEKELVLTKRNVDHKTINNVIDLVEHKYNIVRTRIVEEQEIPGEIRHLRDCRNCEPRRPRAIRSYGTAPRYLKRRD